MKFIFFETIDSTNTYLKSNYQNLNDLTIVFTNHQTQGRGRFDRKWEDNDDLLFSVLLKNNIEKPTDYTFIIALSVLNALASYNIKGSIKWPNDIFVGDKKLAGILLEGIYSSFQECLILGVGINVNDSEFKREFRINATSMFMETKTKTNKEELLKLIIKNFEDLRSEYINNKVNIFELVNEHFYLKEKEISYSLNGSTFKGIAKRVDNEGKLVIEKDNKLIAISSDEVSLHKE